MKSLLALALFVSVVPALAQDLLSCRESQNKDSFQFSVGEAGTADKAKLYAGIYNRERGEFSALAIVETDVAYAERQGEKFPHEYTHKANVKGQDLSVVVRLDSAKQVGEATLSWAPGTTLPCWYGDANDATH